MGYINSKLSLIKKRGSSLKTIGAFAGGNVLASAISGISGILYSRWIKPEDLGEFNKFGILTGYLGIGLIMVHGALPRQYPYLMGKGDLDEASKVSAAAKWWYLFFSWIGTAIYGVMAIKAVLQGDYRATFGWTAQIPALWMAIYGLYLQTMYRSNHDFVKLSNNQIIASVSAFIMLIFVKFFMYWGFLGRFFAQGMISVYVHERFNPAKVKAKFDLVRLKSLAKVSLPLSIPAYIDTYLLNSTLSVMILRSMGETNLGIYSWALMLQGMAMILVRAIHQIYLTKITIKFGETESILECWKYAKIPTLISIGISAIMALVFSLVIGPFVNLVAPNYVESVGVLKILIWQMPVFASGIGLIVLTSALWYKALISLRIAKTALCLGLVYFLPNQIAYVGVSLVAAELFYYVCGYLLLFFSIKTNRVK